MTRCRPIHTLNALVLAMPWCCHVPAHAELKESVIQLRAQVSNAYGKPVEQEFVVTLFEDDAQPRHPRPIAIVLHGRAAEPEKGHK